MGILKRCALVGVLALVAGSLICVVGCSNSVSSDGDSTGSPEIQLQIFAANSMSKALDEVQALYTQQNSNIAFLDTQYEGSGTLVEMLGAGSSADILITASESTMNKAQDAEYVDASTRFDMFTNQLVIVTGSDNEDIAAVSLEDLATGAYSVAVGDDSVPAGTYAKQALSTTAPACWIDLDGALGPESSGTGGTFEGTPLDGNIIEASSVGNVCSYANSGDVDVALVYSSDVYRFGNVKIVGSAPASSHKTILYPAAICADSAYAQEAQSFLTWAFSSEEAIKIWQEWGFELV